MTNRHEEKSSSVVASRMGLSVKVLASCLVILVATSCDNSGVESTSSTAELIEQLRTRRNIETCDGEHGNRSDVAISLGKKGDPAAIAPLLEILSSPDRAELSSGARGCIPRERSSYSAVIRALKEFGPQAKAAVPRLVELTREPESDLVVETLPALIAIDLPQATEEFLRALREPSNDNSTSFVRFLEKLTPALTPRCSELVEELPKYRLLRAGKLLRQETELVDLFFSCAVNEKVGKEALENGFQMLRRYKVLGGWSPSPTAEEGLRRYPEEVTAFFSNLVNEIEDLTDETALKEFTSWCGRDQVGDFEAKKQSLVEHAYRALAAVCSPQAVEFIRSQRKIHAKRGICQSFAKDCKEMKKAAVERKH